MLKGMARVHIFSSPPADRPGSLSFSPGPPHPQLLSGAGKPELETGQVDGLEGNSQVTGKDGLGAAEPASPYSGAALGRRRLWRVIGESGRRVGDECILLHDTLKIKCNDDRLFRAA